MDNFDTCCPFCGKEIGVFKWAGAALYRHAEIFSNPDCDAYYCPNCGAIMDGGRTNGEDY